MINPADPTTFSVGVATILTAAASPPSYIVAPGQTYRIINDGVGEVGVYETSYTGKGSAAKILGANSAPWFYTAPQGVSKLYFHSVSGTNVRVAKVTEATPYASRQSPLAAVESRGYGSWRTRYWAYSLAAISAAYALASWARPLQTFTNRVYVNGTGGSFSYAGNTYAAGSDANTWANASSATEATARANCYATIKGAITAASTNATAGNTNIVVLGKNGQVYAENDSGRLIPRTGATPTSWTKIQSITGNPDDVIITGTSNTAAAMAPTSAADWHKFWLAGVTIRATAGSNTPSALDFSNSGSGKGDNLILTDVKLQGRSSNASGAVFRLNTDTGLNGLYLDNVSFEDLDDGVNVLYGMTVNSFSTPPGAIANHQNILLRGITSTVNGGLFSDFTYVSTFAMVSLDVKARIAVFGNPCYGIIAGSDSWKGSGVVATGGYISDASVNLIGQGNTTGPHALLVGFGASSILVESVDIVGQYQGAVFKSSSSIQFRNFTIAMYGGLVKNGLYYKGCNNVQSLDGSVTVDSGVAIRELDQSTDSPNTSFYWNAIDRVNAAAIGGGSLFDFAISGQASQSGQTYVRTTARRASNGGVFGNIRGAVVNGEYDLGSAWRNSPYFGEGINEAT